MILLWWACAAPPAPSARPGPSGVEVVAEDITQLALGHGATLVTRQTWPQPVDTASLTVEWTEAEGWWVDVQHSQGTTRLDLELPAERPAFSVHLQSPVGQPPAAVGQGPVTVLQFTPDQQARLEVAAHQAGRLVVTTEEGVALDRTVVAGERQAVRLPLAAMANLDVALGEDHRSVRVDPVPMESTQGALAIDGVVFPATSGGDSETARAQGRVTLPSPWWEAILARTSLGFRQRDPWFPWSHTAVGLRNQSAYDLHAIVGVRVLDREGEPAQAFAPRMRDAQDPSGYVHVLVKVPAGKSATATVPLFVDESRLPTHSTEWTREIQVTPVGARQPATVRRDPLVVDRGSGWATAWMAVSVLASLGGWTLLVRGSRRWLRTTRTGDLMVIALFSSLLFVVGAVGRVFAMAVAAALGPFAAFVTALVDDVFRYALLTTLMVLRPKPGTAALALVTTWLLGGFALGSFTAIDGIYIGARVLYLEAALWLAGTTRGSGTRLSTALGFATANALSTATTLALGVVLYRLYYAGWYVAALIAGPGFFYVLAASWIAGPFARSLDEVAS